MSTKTYTPAAGETMQERKLAELEDGFTFDSAVAAGEYKTWDQFLSENYTYRGLCADASHRARFEALRSQALSDLHAGRKTEIDPHAEVAAVRERRRQEYQKMDMDRRYGVIKDTLMESAFNREPWETVAKKLAFDNLSAWDHELYQRACKEAGLDGEPAAPDHSAAFAQGFYM